MMDAQAGYGSSDVAQCAREKYIPSVLNQQYGTLTSILEELNLLTKVLNPILQPTNPVPENGQKNLAAVHESMPPIAEKISEHINMLRTIIDELRAIQSRIEV